MPDMSKTDKHKNSGVKYAYPVNVQSEANTENTNENENEAKSFQLEDLMSKLKNL